MIYKERTVNIFLPLIPFFAPLDVGRIIRTASANAPGNSVVDISFTFQDVAFTGGEVQNN